MKSRGHRRRSVHPGEILRAEFLVPYKLSARALAERLGVPHNRVSSIVAGRREITPDTALRLAKAFGTTPEFWLNLQQAHDLHLAKWTADVRGIRRIRKGGSK
jgi:antitoxin HigA-1